MAGGGGLTSLLWTLATIYILIKYVMPMAMDFAKELPSHLPDLSGGGGGAPVSEPETVEAAPEPEAEDGGNNDETQPEDEDSGEDQESNFGTLLESNYTPVNWN